LIMQFSGLCRSILEIFAIKVESCQKSCQILVVYCPPKFCWGNPSKISVHVITRHRATSLLKFHEVMPTTPKVIGTLLLILKTNFNCSALKFWEGPPTWFVVCASKPWPMSSSFKNFRGQHRLGAEI